MSSEVAIRYEGGALLLCGNNIFESCGKTLRTIILDL